MSRHWRLEQDQRNIAWLHFAHADSPVNILSQAAFTELSERLDELETTQPKGLIILSDKPGGFIAGADVNSFRSGMQQGEAESHIRQVHNLFDRIEALPFPTLALIHGFCLGGGLELALCCDYRLARDDESTRLAFPEVKLGIFPGYGGTVRSIRLIGALPAMQLMLSGRSISGRQAKKIGLVDQVAPERQLKAAAVAIIQRQTPSRRLGAMQRLTNSYPARQAIAPYLARETAKHARTEHYPSPYALIEHWKRHGGDPQAMFRSEASEVSRLLVGDTAQNLIRVFFLQERLKSLGSKGDFTPRQVHVVGGGIMGGDIAAWCALKGLRVTLQDREAKFLSKAVARAHRLFRRKLRKPRRVQAAMDRLMPDPNGYGVSQADVAIEAIFEDVEAKQALFRELEAGMRPDALLATNTSSIPLETIGEALQTPERLIGLHFFNPVAKMQLIEVVHGERTDPDLIHKGAAFARAIDRLPLPVRSSPGFLVNRILMPYLLEALRLVDEGVPAPAIDRAAAAFGMPMGPVELADAVGLDICLAVAKKLAPLFDLRIPDKLEQRVEQGQLGKKSGNGFYRYDKGRMVKQKVARDYQPPADLADRMIFRLLNESVACLREGVVEDEDLLDAGVIFGTGYAPFRGGPMHTIHSGGLEQQRQQLELLEQRHGNQFHPDAGWAKLGGV
ncbi:MAG: enoyl-CoA hydratase/isomerase family protein [Candidatus Thiodiazotropha sp. (ex Dulcina madagascariensis)]|nr:enoyl-CoA hydratase/isomerase family protein [Candidatus Thiodiazotropha sp. (ex Dulcina madagascariensis)]